MGIKAWFGLGGPMSERKVQKASKLASNAFAQPEVRMREMQRLLKDGSPRAIRGVLRRFGVNAQGHIADEEEKDYLSGALAGLGDPVLAPLEDYIRTEAKLTWALSTYRKVAGEQAATRFFIATLESIGREDHRRIEPKEQLVRELKEHAHAPEVLAALVPYLRDHADEVRSSVLELFFSACAKGSVDEQVSVALTSELGHLVCDEGVSLRVAQGGAKLLSQQGWALSRESGALSAALQESYFIDKGRHVHAKASA